MRKPLAAVAAAICLTFAAAGTASAAPTWAPASTATVHPGVLTDTGGAQCTANFIYTDAVERLHRPGRALLGHRRADRHRRLHRRDAARRHAGHRRRARPSPARSSTTRGPTMQATGETDADTCAYNDIALIKLDPADCGNVNPSVPYCGRPDRPRRTTAQGDTVYSYGNSSLRAGRHRALAEASA